VLGVAELNGAIRIVTANLSIAFLRMCSKNLQTSRLKRCEIVKIVAICSMTQKFAAFAQIRDCCYRSQKFTALIINVDHI